MFLVPKTRVTAGHVWGGVDGHAVVYMVNQPYQAWSMPHIALIKRWDTISIPVSSSLDNYATDEGHGSEEALSSSIQGNSWVCQGCSSTSCRGLSGDPPLSDMVNASYNTHRMVGYQIRTWVIILAPLLHHWWDPWFKLLVPISMVKAEHVWGVVGGYAMVCGMIQAFQTWSMPHVKLIKWSDNIFIPVSSSLNHYNTDEDHGSSSWSFQYAG